MILCRIAILQFQQLHLAEGTVWCGCKSWIGIFATSYPALTAPINLLAKTLPSSKGFGRSYAYWTAFLRFRHCGKGTSKMYSDSVSFNPCTNMFTFKVYLSRCISLKVYVSKCISQSVSLSKCVSPKMFSSVYLSKCVSLKVYLSKCLSQYLGQTWCKSCQGTVGEVEHHCTHPLWIWPVDLQDLQEALPRKRMAWN